MKVVKFGGSSMADASHVKKVADIIKSDNERKVVVVSAAGKRNKKDSKITDLLYLCDAHVQYGQSCEPIFQQVKDRYNEIIDGLNLEHFLDEEFDKLLKQIDKGKIDKETLASRGEYFSAKIIAKYLDFEFIDACDCIKFNYDKSINQDKTYEAIKQIKINKGIVVPGFYGMMENGNICTFTRGGSDITASLLAAAYDVDLYENWTDVSGILMADPNIVDKPQTISNLNFEELRLLSCYGAQVLHEGAVYPVRQKNIPLNIRNTNDPKNPGSLISNDKSKTSNSDRFITGISGKKGFSIVVLFKQKMSRVVDDLANVLKVLQEFGIEVDYVHNGIDRVSFAVQKSILDKNKYSLLSKLQDVIKPDNIKVHENIALVAAVGSNMVSYPGVSGKIFSSLGKQNINIRIINQGPDESTIIFGVENKDFENVIKIIYEVFVK